jgi:hypothetical protein
MAIIVLLNNQAPTTGCFVPFPMSPQKTRTPRRRTTMSMRAFRLLLVVCLATGTLWAADDPFVGKWKLDPAKSKLTDIMKVESVGANKYNLDLGGGVIETIVPDGTDQPGVYGTTLAISADGPGKWTVVRKKDGRTQITGIWSLSQDGTRLTDHFTSYQADGSTRSLDYIYAKNGNGAGFAGIWESVSEKVNSSFEIQVQPYEQDGLTFTNPSQQSTINMRFDGKDYPNQGPNDPAGYVSSGRRVDQHALQLTDKIEARTLDTRDFNLSPDLKTLTVTIHRATLSKPNILVFDRQ